MTEKLLEHNKIHLVESTEDAIEAEVEAWTQGIMRRSRRLPEDEEDDEGGGGGGGRQGGREKSSGAAT